MKKGSKCLTLTQRRQLEGFLSAKLHKRKIAELLGVSLATVYREIKRGESIKKVTLYDPRWGELYYKNVIIYSADKAEENYRLNLTAKGAPLKVGKDFDFIRYVERRVLVDGISPCAVVGEIKRNKLCNTVVSKTTMYRYIQMGMFMNVSMRNCPMGQRKKQYRKATVKRPPRGTSIEKRPLEISKRDSFGHWEMDCVCSKQNTKSALLVFSERLTRYEIIMRIPNKKTATVVDCVDKLEKQYGQLFSKLFKSITVDNGVEFSDFAGLEKSIYGGKRTNVYYCHPYTSCERGTNERLNRDIRRKFPKGTDFTDVSDKEVKAVEIWLNKYPREIFGFSTAAEKFNEQLSVI